MGHANIAITGTVYIHELDQQNEDGTYVPPSPSETEQRFNDIREYIKGFLVGIGGLAVAGILLQEGNNLWVAGSLRVWAIRA